MGGITCERVHLWESHLWGGLLVGGPTRRDSFNSFGSFNSFKPKTLWEGPLAAIYFSKPRRESRLLQKRSFKPSPNP